MLGSESCCRLTRTHIVGPPTKFRFNVGPASQPKAGEAAGHSQAGISPTQPIAGSMPTNSLRCCPTLLQHWVCCILSGCKNVTFTRFRCWLKIETTSGDCSVFAVTAHYYATDPAHLPSLEKPLPR